MANIAQQFRALNAYINTQTESADADSGNFAGKVEEFHPPQLKIMTAEYHASGMDAPVLLDMGMEPLVARLIINGYFGQALENFGLADANAALWEVKGGLEDYDGKVKTVRFEMTGNIVDMPFSRIRGRGEVPKMVIEIACSKYQIFIGDTEHVHIDILNYIRRIGSTDRLEKLREAIGL